ncbi:hypothetical protein DL93DRAFT_2092212 [Clavulina sp. PMI_390]|nr:hypothetical protein DL93DRAFT_2092212 [Clavulina sp. PMI_390]
MQQGYGIRFLPSYVDSLAQSFALPSGTNPERPRNYSKSGPSLPALEHIAFRAAEWTQKAIEKYGHSAQWTHAMLEDRAIVTSEPGERSCLTRFELLMRHVELWREHVNGNIMLSDEVWASNNYDVGPTGYDDSPVYTWGKGFNLEGLKRALEEYNEKDARNFRATYSEMPTDHSGDSDPKPLEETGQTRRVCYAPDASSLLQPQGDVVLLFFASPGFADFANGLVKEALREHSLPVPENEEIIEVLGSWDLEDREKELEALRWRINSILGWQQIDRRIDEVSEILWSFYRSYGEARLQMDDTQRKFLTEVARRAIRPSPTDEYEAFGVWVMRGAPRIGYSYGGEGQGFFGWTSDEDDDDIDEWDSAIDDESRWFDEFS